MPGSGTTRMCGSSASWTGLDTRDPNTVPVTSNPPCVHVRSPENDTARSASRPTRRATRASPVSSVSSVNGVGANDPPPPDTRIVHAVDGRSEQRQARTEQGAVLAVRVQPARSPRRSRCGRGRSDPARRRPAPKTCRRIVTLRRERSGPAGTPRPAPNRGGRDAPVNDASPNAVCRVPRSRTSPNRRSWPLREYDPRAVRHARAEQPSAEAADVGAPRLQAFGERQPVGRDRRADGAGLAILGDQPAGQEQRRARAGFVEDARTDDTALVGRHVGPPVVVHVAAALAVCAAEQGPGPAADRRPAEPHGGVDAAQRRGVEQRLDVRLAGRAG